MLGYLLQPLHCEGLAAVAESLVQDNDQVASALDDYSCGRRGFHHESCAQRENANGGPGVAHVADEVGPDDLAKYTLGLEAVGHWQAFLRKAPRITHDTDPTTCLLVYLIQRSLFTLIA